MILAASASASAAARSIPFRSNSGRESAPGRRGPSRGINKALLLDRTQRPAAVAPV